MPPGWVALLMLPGVGDVWRSLAEAAVSPGAVNVALCSEHALAHAELVAFQTLPLPGA
jgi:hypothetical protein